MAAPMYRDTAREQVPKRASSALLDTPRSDSPHLAEAVSLAVLFAMRACSSLAANGTLKKIRPTGYVFRC